MASEWRTKVSLRVKKYLKVMSFLSFWNDGIGRLFPRQADVRAETPLRPAPFVARLHDAGTGTGDDHPTVRGNLRAKSTAC